jgi:ribulose-5-phosphate 4-epimerase/fuculose-1-phosphate aldolase
VRARDRSSSCARSSPLAPPAFSALGRQLDRINQDVCAFDDCTVLVPFGGAVFDSLEGQRIASFFRPDTKVALLQNHGALCLGRLSIDEAAWWQISYEMCCKAQLLVDAASHRPSGLAGAALPNGVVRVGDDECASTKLEIGTAEMGWFCMAPYIEDEMWESKGDHLW